MTFIVQDNNIVGCSANPNAILVGGENQNGLGSGEITYCIDGTNPSIGYVDINSNIDFDTFYMLNNGEDFLSQYNISGDNGLFSFVSGGNYSIFGLATNNWDRDLKLKFELKDTSKYISDIGYSRDSLFLATNTQVELYNVGLVFNTAQYQQPTPSVSEPNSAFMLGATLLVVASVKWVQKKRI
jgi:hypothetical protein